jgi:hypothetical protein
MAEANSCDVCGRVRSTLYEGGEGALRTIRTAVTGAVNIERRRRSLQKIKAKK